MERAITGSVSPRPALHSAGLPPTNRSKRGASIAGIPSLGGPPDLIVANGTLCLEKSVRGHSERQPTGSASSAPRRASTAAPSSVASMINAATLRFGGAMPAIFAPSSEMVTQSAEETVVVGHLE